VVDAYLLQSLADAARPESRDSDKDILSSCVGLFFFGVPNRGLDLNSLRTLVRDQKNADFLGNLSEGSEFLKFAHDYFARAVETELEGCQIVSFYETKDTPSVEALADGSWSRSGKMIRVVAQESATNALPNESVCQQIAIDADHSNMVKFTDDCDHHYIAVRERLSECVANAPRIIKARLACTVGRGGHEGTSIDTILKLDYWLVGVQRGGQDGRVKSQAQSIPAATANFPLQSVCWCSRKLFVRLLGRGLWSKRHTR